MTGLQLLTKLQSLSPEELLKPVVMENAPDSLRSLHSCRNVIFDPEMQEIVILGTGPFHD